MREGVETLQGGAGEGEGGGLVSPLLLTSLHHSLVAQVSPEQMKTSRRICGLF